MQRRDFIAADATAGALGGLHPTAGAQARPKDVLVVATEFGPNSLDMHTVGANRASYRFSWLGHDRLMSYGKKALHDGRLVYDIDKLEPELAESWKGAPDGNSVTFKLRKGAKFDDGTPVTAKDVKWSFDRAVTVGGYPTFQMAAGSLDKPEQFEVVGRRHGGGADGGADSGVPGADRHQYHHQQGPRRHLAFGLVEEGHALADQPFWRLAE